MDYRVVWSPEAADDVESIADYIARDSEFYARSVAAKIIDTTRNLQKFPKAGRVVPELNDESIRERFVYNFRLIYRIRENVVTIAAVVHGKRALDRMADRFGDI